ncbi:Curli production assembly/transport component CsgG [bacterium HR13]|nr:Curli production assembly/transport component CsgG [bacterium HR13]
MRAIRKLLMPAILLSMVVNGAFAQDEEYAKEVKERILKLPQCSRPIGVITARSFKCKAAACQGERVYFGPGYGVEFSTKALGDGLSDMLITALANTNCFKVVERIALEEIKEELELMGVKPQATLKTADYIITGAVTALELKASGVGGGGVVVPLPFGLGAKFGKSKAHIALDMRIVQVKTGEILSAKTVEGKSERWNIGVAGGGLFGSTFGGAYFEAVKNTPLEEATRDLIVRAVALIVESVKAQAPAGVVVGERVQVYNEKGELVKEEVVMPKAAVVEAPKRPEAEPSPSGGLVRESVEASSYPKTLWQEDFSTCKVVPTNIKIIRGQGECVGMGGKKWLATTKGDLVFERNISGFDPPKNFTVEGRVYYSQKGGTYMEDFRLYLGKEGSPVSIILPRSVSQWKYGESTPIPNQAGLPDMLVNKDFKFMLKKEGELVHLFINGTRVLTTQVDAVALKNLPAKIVIKMFGNDIGEGSYVLLTDLRVTSQ